MDKVASQHELRASQRRLVLLVLARVTSAVLLTYFLQRERQKVERLLTGEGEGTCSEPQDLISSEHD